MLGVIFQICKSIYYRLQSKVPDNILEYIKIRVIPVRDSMPLTPSGKRSSKVLENEEFGIVENLKKYIKQDYQRKLILQ